MIRLTYSNSGVTGTLTCEFCGKTQTIPGNVHTWMDGDKLRTHPDARLVVDSHFNYDTNSQIDVCTALETVENTFWEAVDVTTGNVIAHGRVEVETHQYGQGRISAM